MLFDLEDYAWSGFFGNANGHWSNGGFDGIAIPPVLGKQHSPFHWVDAESTWNATRVAYMKATKEYIVSSLFFSAVSEKPAILAAELDIYTKFRTLMPISRNFWNALKTLAVKGQFSEGDTIGILNKPLADNFGIVGYDFEAIQNRDMILEPMTAFLVNESTPQGALSYGQYVYTEMTQELYDSYSEAFKAWMGAYKGLYLAVDGATFEEYVAPVAPAWESYPELSGYVRGTNNLTIKDAVVRLIDEAGESHDVITDANGYYKFTKEMFYNSIAFDHDAASSSFNMFVLEHTLGSTASLYDPTNILQNSFFGAENDRELTWTMPVKMGKALRRNFKLEFIPDYSDFPSFSGYVKDAAGNPIKDAFVMIKDYNSGFGIGQYIKPNGTYGINFKYNDFGVEKTILTDENGFYEYTSQMVGEWFNKELMNINGQSHLGGRTFDQYFVNPVQDFMDNYTGRYLDTNETFSAFLIPYVQDVDNTSIIWESDVSIYDNNDYYTSRFKYALNQNNEFFYQKIELNTHYDIDVDVTVAVGDEVRADKVFFELDDRSKEVNGGFNIHLRAYANQNVKIVYPKTGESYQFSGDYDSSWHLSINSTNFDDYSEFYIYACDNSGRAFGYINQIDIAQSGYSVFKSIDVSGLSYLRSLKIEDRFYGESIDVSGMNYLASLYLDSIFIKNIEGLESKKLDNLEIYSAQVETLDLSKLVNLRQMWITRLSLLESLDLVHNTKLELLSVYDTNVNLNVVGLTSLLYITYNKITMTSDDVDDLLIQLADNPAKADGSFGQYGNIQIASIARSSYSDSAYDILSSRGWGFILGTGFYPDLIEPKKLVLTIDPNLVDKYSEYLSISLNVQTSTGYWIGKLFNGGKIGYVPGYNLWDNTVINTQYKLGIENATIEIYSCDENGIPQGDITSFELSDGFVFSDIDTSELTELTNLVFYGSGSIELLDLKSNIKLDHLNVVNCATIESIDVTGLTSLKHINIGNSSLGEVIGFSTLSSLETLYIDALPNLPYLSLAGLNNLQAVGINQVDLYESANVDTILSELNTNSVAGVASLDAEIVVKQAELDVNQTAWDLLMSDLQALYGELSQLVADGADQSLIDAKQAIIDAKEIDNNSFYNQQQVISEALNILNSDRLNYFSQRQVNTNYMARTSASDADYDSLIAFGWTLNLGQEFVGPYTQPVKGHMMINSKVNDPYASSYSTTSVRFISDSGRVKFESSNGWLGFCNNNWDMVSTYNGIVEFWSVNQHGRPSGKITEIETDDYKVTEVELSNLTDLTSVKISNTNLVALDLTGLNKIDTLEIRYNSKLENLELNDLVNLTTFMLDENRTISSLDISSMAKLIDLNIKNNANLTSLDISNNKKLHYLQVHNQDFIPSIDVAGLNYLRGISFNSFRTFTSADLDVLLGQLDQNVIAQIATQSALIDVLTTQKAAKQAEHDAKLAELYAFLEQEPTNTTLSSERDAFLAIKDVQVLELQQLISDGADQALIDAKLAESVASDAAASAKQDSINDKNVATHVIEDQLILIDSEILSFDNQIGQKNDAIYAINHGTLNTDYVGRTSASDVAFDNLASYGWDLQLGSEFIGPNEAPIKNRVYYSGDAGWTMLGFDFENGGNARFRMPDGSMQTTTTIQWSFNSSMPEADRYIEFWGCDSHGRPTNNITGISDWWQCPIKSITFNGLTKLLQVYIYNNSYITSMDFTGLSNLISVNAYNNSNLESMIFTGCSKIRTIEVNDSNKLNADQLILSIDSTGSEGNPNDWGTNVLNATTVTRTHSSDVAAESLFSKNWRLNVKEPDGTPVVFHVRQDAPFGISISTSGGRYKILYKPGTQEYNNYPDGELGGNWCKYNAPNDFQQAWFAMNPSYSGDITIVSCDGDGNASGEVRFLYIDCNEGSLVDFSTLSKLKVLHVQYIKPNFVAGLSTLSLSKLLLNYTHDTFGSTLDLSNVSSKIIELNNMDGVINANFKSDLKELLMVELNLTALNLPSGLKGLEINYCTILQTIDLPSNLEKISISNSSSISWIGNLPNSLVQINLNSLNLGYQSLDLSNMLNLKTADFNNTGSTLTSLDITGLQKIEGISIYSTYIDTIVGLESSKLKTLNNVQSRATTANFVLPISIQNCTINDSSNLTSVNISVLDNTFLTNSYFYLGYCNSVTSLSTPSLEYITLGQSDLFVLPTNTEERTRLQISNVSTITSLDFTGVTLKSLRLYYCQNLVSITGLSGYLETLTYESLDSLRTSDFSNLDVQGINFYYLNNFTAMVKAKSLRVQYSTNIDLSGSRVDNQIQTYGNYASINLSNINTHLTNWQASNCNIYVQQGYMTQVNLDGTIGTNLYFSNGYGYNNQNWSVSLINSSFQYVDIRENNRMVTIDATGASIWEVYFRNNNQLTNVKLNVKGSNSINIYENNLLTNVELYDANLALAFNRINMRDNNSFTATTVDNIINSVSLSNKTNIYMILARVSNRTSASQTAFTKLLNQGWSINGN